MLKAFYYFFVALLPVYGFSLQEASSIVNLTPSIYYIENLYYHPLHSQFITVGAQADGNFLSGEGRFYSHTSAPEICNVKSFRNGTTLFLCETISTAHYAFDFFHILEHLIGVWKAKGEQIRDNITTVVLAGNGSDRPLLWRGPDNRNEHIIKALFPHAAVITWQDFKFRSRMGVVQLERCIISDRLAYQKQVPSSMTNLVLSIDDSFSFWEDMSSISNAVHQFMGTKNSEADSLRVTYAKPSISKGVSTLLEQKLIERLKTLRSIQLRIVDFSKTSFNQDLEVISKTDILIGAHDVSLALSAFLHEEACLIELFPKDTLSLDYRLLTSFKGIEYYGISGDEILDDETAFEKGNYGNVHEKIEFVNSDQIASLVKLFRAGIMQYKSVSCPFPKIENNEL